MHDYNTVLEDDFPDEYVFPGELDDVHVHVNPDPPLVVVEEVQVWQPI